MADTEIIPVIDLGPYLAGTPGVIDRTARELRFGMTATPWSAVLIEALRRARRLDEQIVRTIATSTSGLLAQLRLLSAFFDESTKLSSGESWSRARKII